MTFEILPGLPGRGPRAKPFSATQKAWLQAGFVVRFTPGSGNSWVGNFQPGTGGATEVLSHPDGSKVVVVVSGHVYVVDPDARAATTFPGVASSIHTIDSPSLLVFEDQGIQFQAIGPEGLRWRTKRISWHAIRNVVIEGNRLSGEACDATGMIWESFEVDLRTGRTTGGSYALADAAYFEKISDGN